jgi:hypothetical protein
MKKVITFSLWGNNPTYNVGAIKNAELAKVYYPDFECWFYIHQDTVPLETIENLSKLDNTKIILKTGDLNNCKPAMWRFEAIDEYDVEIMMSRDTDTRILLREKLAVEQWLNSDKIFHIMRDHPYHLEVIMAGMFGIKKNKIIENWKEKMNNYNQNIYSYGYDQYFLRDYIYPHIIDYSMIHATFSKFEGNRCLSFPINYDEGYNFVGQYVYANEDRNNDHTQHLKNQFN